VVTTAEFNSGRGGHRKTHPQSLLKADNPGWSKERSMQSDLILEPGSELNGWVMLELRARSRVHEVWRAQNYVTNQLAELKLYDPRQIPQTMVLREIDLLNQLRPVGMYPCIMSYFPFRDSFAILTKPVEGYTLADLLEGNSRGLPPELAESTSRALLVALDQMHQLPGTPVHRALAPQNLLADDCMNICVTGLVFAEPVEELEQSETLYFNFGDPRYQPPEVFDDPRALSLQSNVYSCGAIIFELFTGRRPFDSFETDGGRWYEDLGYQHRNLPAPLLSDYAPGLAERITSVVDAALSKDPASRPATCRLFVELLSGVEAETEPAPQPTVEPEKHGFWSWFRAKDAVR
jgi:serine/threonine protein kinase